MFDVEVSIDYRSATPDGDRCEKNIDERYLGYTPDNIDERSII